MLDISRFVGIAAPVNPTNLPPRNWKRIDPEAGMESPDSAQPGAAYFERELGLKCVPRNQTGKPPPFQPISAIDFLVKTLQQKADASESSAGDWKELFLQAFAKAPIPAVAAKVAGVSRAQAAKARMSDPDFARRCGEAYEEGVDEIEAAAFRSAVYGEEKPVFYRGHPIGWTVNFSQAMRAMLLKAFRPADFGKQGKPKETKAVGMTLAELRERVAEARRFDA